MGRRSRAGPIKVDAVRAMGAEVVLAGDSYADAKAHSDTLAGRVRAHLQELALNWFATHMATVAGLMCRDRPDTRRTRVLLAAGNTQR